MEALGPMETRVLALERRQVRIGDDLAAVKRQLIALDQGIWDAWADLRAGNANLCTATYTGTLLGCGSVGLVGQTLTLLSHASGMILGTATSMAAGAFSGSIQISDPSEIVDVTTAITGYVASSNTFTFSCGANALGNISPTGIANTAPTITSVGNLTVCGDGSTRTVSLTGITDGDGGTQPPLTVTATSGNTSFIPNPTITYTSPNSTGTLSYVATNAGITQPNVSITVKVVDSGGTACGGTNTATMAFSIKVIPTGNPISFNSISNVSTGVPVGSQTVNFSGINAGPSVTGTPTWTVGAVSSNPGVMAVTGVTYTSPSSSGSIQLSYGGSLGVTTITVTLTFVSTTGIACGLPSTTATHTFTWTVS